MKSSLGYVLRILLLVSSGVYSYIGHGQSPSKWDFSLEHQVTRCFKTKNIHIRCDSDEIPGSGGKISAELEILAQDVNNRNFIYGYGKSIEGNLCAGHLKRIKVLLEKQNQACITGDGEQTLESNEVFARWKDLETRVGKVSW